MASVEEQISTRFACSKCKSSSSHIRRFAATGSGLSRFIDWQHNEFLSVSCARCGFTELYDPQVFQDKDHLTEVLDLLFGLSD